MLQCHGHGQALVSSDHRLPQGKKVSGLYQVSDQVGGLRALQLVLASGCTLSSTLFAAVTTPEYLCYTTSWCRQSMLRKLA